MQRLQRSSTSCDAGICHFELGLPAGGVMRATTRRRDALQYWAVALRSAGNCKRRGHFQADCMRELPLAAMAQRDSVRTARGVSISGAG